MSPDNSQEVKKVFRALTALLFIGSIVLTIVGLSALKQYTYIGRDVPAYNIISVQGEGEAFMAPDTATFTFGVTREAATVAEAQAHVSERIEEVLAGLESFNIEEKDIRTESYNAYPRYEFQEREFIAQTTIFPGPPRGDSERVLVGYEVSQRISVKVRDLDQLSGVVQKLGELNVDNLNGPNLTIDDEDALVAEAREKAIEDARGKARDIARELGVKIVRVVGFGEYGGGSNYGYGGDFARAESLDGAVTKVEIPAGENKSVVNVTVTYEIK